MQCVFTYLHHFFFLCCRIAITASLYLTSNTQNTREHGNKFRVPAGCVDVFSCRFFLATIQIWKQLPANVITHHVSVYRSTRVTISKQCSDSDVNASNASDGVIYSQTLLKSSARFKLTELSFFRARFYPKQVYFERKTTICCLCTVFDLYLLTRIIK